MQTYLPRQSSGQVGNQGSLVRPHQEPSPPRPHLRVQNFSVRNSPNDDKSMRQGENQDSLMSVSSLQTETSRRSRGIGIKVEADRGRAARGGGIGALGGLAAVGAGLGIAALAGVTRGAGLIVGALAGGALLGGGLGAGIGAATGTEYLFLQTIDTNVPLGGSTSPYVDPRPNDDTKPFYYTDAEQATFGNTFIDHPSRPIPSTDTTNWDATLSVAEVSNKAVSVYESLTYGFSVDTAGAVTARNPRQITGVNTHLKTLRSEFPDWSFTRT